MGALESFVAERQGNWSRLEALLSKVQTGQLHALSADELEEMTRLYRLAASDLARARRDFRGDRVVAYLNRLVSSAYSSVYSTSGFSWGDIVRWYAVGFPRLFRAVAGYYVVAALLLFGPMLLSFIAVASSLQIGQVLLPASDYQSVVSAGQSGQLWTEGLPPFESPYLAAFIMTNNIKVAIFAFAGGMLLGLGTLYVLIYNGVSVGAILGILAHYGLSFRLLSFMSGHGVIELSVICLSGAAGLMLADAILRPGMLERGEALRLAAQQAVQLLLGGASLLVVAGTIEGFLSPSSFPDWVKFGVGLVTGILLYGYWLFAGRRHKEESLQGGG